MKLRFPLGQKGNLHSTVPSGSFLPWGWEWWVWERAAGSRVVRGGLGFVLILLKAASVLCRSVSWVIRRSCSHFPFVSIRESSGV